MIARFKQLNKDFETEKELEIACERVELDVKSGQVNVFYADGDIDGISLDEPAIGLEQIDKIAIEPQLFVHYRDGSCQEVLDILPGELPGEIMCKVTDNDFIVNLDEVYCITARRLPGFDLISSEED